MEFLEIDPPGKLINSLTVVGTSKGKFIVVAVKDKDKKWRFQVDGYSGLEPPKNRLGNAGLSLPSACFGGSSPYPLRPEWPARTARVRPAAGNARRFQWCDVQPPCSPALPS